MLAHLKSCHINISCFKRLTLGEECVNFLSIQPVFYEVFTASVPFGSLLISNMILTTYHSGMSLCLSWYSVHYRTHSF